MSKEAKQTLAVLESTLAVEKPVIVKDQIVDIRKQELFSAVPWINRWLLKLDLAPRLSRLLYQADLKWTAGTLILMSVVCFAASGYLMYLRTGGAILSLLIGLLFGCGPIAYVLHKRHRRFGKFEQELPEALDMMVSALRVGQSLISALDLVAKESPDPVGTEFRICCEEQNYGLELRTALSNLTSRVPIQDLNMMATAILIQKETGGNLAEVLDKVSHVIRERFRMRRQIRVHTAQGRMTGWILSFLPVVLGLALYMVNPETMSILWKRPIGIKLLYASGSMTLIGALIIRKIVRMDV
ncbi:type II secretion system F family protein [Alloacidobacterium dinghuense]|uniref:type II secretion system F family protein n=1 Tax=Alloacidobacterium dinghuense TaxID=2763107 RepID=UPI002036B585|nr:type II secretion system F family protein [Alloacidobacterium dinghuense]